MKKGKVTTRKQFVSYPDPPPFFFNRDNETLKISLLNDVTRKLKKKMIAASTECM